MGTKRAPTIDGAPGCAGAARPGPGATVETRLGCEAGGALGAPGGPGANGGAGAWLKGGPTPEAACWRGLMGETVGETSVSGELSQKASEALLCLFQDSQRGPSPAFWLLAASTAFCAAT